MLSGLKAFGVWLSPLEPEIFRRGGSSLQCSPNDNHEADEGKFGQTLTQLSFNPAGISLRISASPTTKGWPCPNRTVCSRAISNLQLPLWALPTVIPSGITVGNTQQWHPLLTRLPGQWPSLGWTLLRALKCCVQFCQKGLSRKSSLDQTGAFTGLCWHLRESWCPPGRPGLSVSLSHQGPAVLPRVRDQSGRVGGRPQS